MVCQHQNTISLLEVGEEAQKNYLDQSKKTTPSFLLQGIDIANDCDLKYKTSKNQRLLVELTLMKLASINFDGEKKNFSLDQNLEVAIAPAAFYKNHTPTQTPITNTKATEETPIATTTIVIKETHASNTKNIATEYDVTPKTKQVVAEPEVNIASKSIPESEKAPEHKEETPIPTLNINIPNKRVSGLSISSLKTKKEHQLNKKEVVIDESKLPRTTIVEEDMQKHWADFVQKIDNDGRKILASNLNTDIPKLRNETTLWIELPNDTMKKEIEREQYDLMEYLRSKLNNHFIKLQITVNEQTAKKFAFTPEEKYEKLREKNPVIDLLRKEFDLDI